MLRVNAGNLWTGEYLDEVIRLNSVHTGIKVKSLFGSIAWRTPTARSFDRLPTLIWPEIVRYVERARSEGIKIRYTLNPSCIGNIQDFKLYWEDGLRAEVLKLHSAGIDEWTITSPLLMELLREALPNDFLEVSTIAEVSTVEDALRWRDIGASGVNVSTSINRNFSRIRDINKVLEVSVLANEACLYRCPWRRDCYNLSSHNSSRSEELFGFYPFRRCNEVRLREPVEWLKSRMILPQWMSLYSSEAGVQWFKVAYRTHPFEVAVPILQAYMDTDYHGNLCELWPTVAHLGKTIDPKTVTDIPCDKLGDLLFIKKWLTTGDCDNYKCGVECQYCHTMLEKIKDKDE